MTEFKMTLVTSSNIHSIGHDLDGMTARIQFTNGSTYDYAGVTADDFQELLSAPSVGQHFNRVFKPRYKDACTKATTAPTKEDAKAAVEQRKGDLATLREAEKVVLLAAVQWSVMHDPKLRDLNDPENVSLSVEVLQKAVEFYTAHPLSGYQPRR